MARTARTDSVGKLPSKTDLDRLNDLIAFYDRFKPDAGKSIPVAMTPRAMCKMLGVLPTVEFNAKGKPVEKWQSEIDYRGRTIVARELRIK